MEHSRSAAPDDAARSLASGLGFTEGPIITPSGDVLVTSIDQGALYRITPSGPELVALLGGGANGATLAADGSVFVAQNGGRWSRLGPVWGPDSVGGVQAVDADGTFRWLTRDPISPNDLCFGPDGKLYVTDPTRSPSGDDGRLWRIDPVTGAAELLLSVPWFPNGIGFGPDDALYVASTFDSRIMRLRLQGDRVLAPEIFIQMEFGRPDGFAFDRDGNVLVGTISTLDGRPGEVQVWDSAGKFLHAFGPGPGPKYTNVALSPDSLLVVTDSARGEVLCVDAWPVPGLALYPFRQTATN